MKKQSERAVPSKGTKVEVCHYGGHTKELDYASESDTTIFLSWPLTGVVGFDIKTGNGKADALLWHITNAGREAIGLSPVVRKARPLEPPKPSTRKPRMTSAQQRTVNLFEEPKK